MTEAVTVTRSSQPVSIFSRIHSSEEKDYVSANAIKETLDKVVSIFDRLADETMCNLLVLGLEGKNYEVVDGVAKMLPDEDGSANSFYVNNIYNPYSVPLAVRWPNLRTISVEMDYGAQRNLEIIEENAPYAVPNDTLGLISDLYSDIGSDLDTLLSDAKTLYGPGRMAGQGEAVERGGSRREIEGQPVGAGNDSGLAG